ncbi:MAG: winged helix-turn-helix domain-containing protein [Conexivisphaerales archaeon]
MVKKDPKTFEMRRRIAIKLLLYGKTQKEVAKIVSVTQSGVSRWWTTYKSKGDQTLNAGKYTRKPVYLNDGQRKKLVEVILKGAESYGFETDIRTTRRVVRVIYETLGIKYHSDHVRRILHSLGLSWKRVDSVVMERNEGPVKKWTVDTLSHKAS